MRFDRDGPEPPRLSGHGPEPITRGAPRPTA
ncbi:hypothetical protein AB0K27_09590 [Micromonospora echinospora]